MKEKEKEGQKERKEPTEVNPFFKRGQVPGSQPTTSLFNLVASLPEPFSKTAHVITKL